MGSEQTSVLRALVKDRTFVLGFSIIAVIVFACLAAPLLTTYGPWDHDLAQALQAPSGAHPLGTDEQGRDLFCRMLYGGRLTLFIAVTSVFAAFILGAGAGVAAGYLGGRTENIIMRATDVLLAFPSILLAIAIIATVGVGTTNIILAVGIYSVPQFARVARSATISVVRNDYVQAAVALGASHWGIVFRHVLPNALAPILVQATFRMASAILTAASLSFLGLGVPPGEPEWGAILNVGKKYLRVAPYLSTFPGLAIFLTIMGLNLMGDGLRDTLDPSLK
jgi:peptide/nickel transport system permease protein